MRNLENYGVQELSITEAKQIDGGWLVAAIGLVIAGIKLFRKLKKGKK